MKKKIIYATIAFLSLLASSLPLSAQTPSVTTSGSITSTPDADGNYWFTFESYATGQHTERLSDPIQKTVDVVLVVECSYSSIKYTSNKYKVNAYEQQETYTYKDIKNAIGGDFQRLFLHDDGCLYAIKAEGNSSSGYLYYEVGTTTYWLSDTPSGYSKTKPSSQFNGNLPTSCNSRIHKKRSNTSLASDNAINNIVTGFISSLNSSNKKSYINFGLVRYCADYYNNNHLTTYNATGASGATALVQGLTSVSSTSINTLSVPDDTKNNISRADYGMQIAKEVLTAASNDHQKVIILVTPNAPGSAKDDNYGINYDANVANAAIAIATELKNDGVQIYTIGIHATKTNETYFSTFLSSISSADTESQKFKYETSDGGTALTGLTSILANSIAEHSVVTEMQNTTICSCDVEGSSTLRNTVSGKFILPSDAATKAKVQYAPCTGGTYGSPTFGAVSDFSTGAPSVSVTDGKLTVTGFNYKDNWAGPSTVSGSTTYHGRKLVVRIPVTTAADNPGGASVAVGVTPSLTIGETSITAPAVSTNVALPNLTISASGLKSTENALFRVTSTYKTSGSDGVQTNTDASRTFNVMVHGDNPVTLKALPFGTYSITPLNWPWAYESKPSPVTNKELDGTGSKETFTFSNSASSPHHGEDSSSTTNNNL